MRVIGDPGVVDEITISRQGKIRLVAITHARLEDTPQVREAVLAKLKSYLDRILSPEFHRTYGDDRPVEIMFRCTAEPSPTLVQAATEVGKEWCASTGGKVEFLWAWREASSIGGGQPTPTSRNG